jgi:hypothetical protein
MKNLFDFDLKFLIILILSALLFFEKCDSHSDENKQTVEIDGKKYKLLKYKVDTFEIYKTQTVTKKGDDIYHENYSVDTAYLKQYTNIDTPAIINDYFSKNVYKDTLIMNDSLGYVYIIDTITKNKLSHRQWASKVRERLVRETTIVKDPPKVEYYLGLNANFDKKDYLNSIGASAMLKNKNNNIIQLNAELTNKPYTTTQQFTPYFGGGVYWKIGKK